jgi:hypothetical protein
MNQFVKILISAMAVACTRDGSVAWAEGTPTNGRERFFLKRQNCPWTEEMGKAIYECVKANDGFNAHWCHNDALDKYCPADENAIPHPTEQTEKKG